MQTDFQPCINNAKEKYYQLIKNTSELYIYFRGIINYNQNSIKALYDVSVDSKKEAIKKKLKETAQKNAAQTTIHYSNKNTLWPI